MEDAEAARSGSEGVGLAAVVGGKDVDEAAMMFLAALARFESEPMMTIRVVEHRWRGNRGDVVAPVEGVPMECDDDRGRVEEAGSTEAAQLAGELVCEEVEVVERPVRHERHLHLCIRITRTRNSSTRDKSTRGRETLI